MIQCGASLREHPVYRAQLDWGASRLGTRESAIAPEAQRSRDVDAADHAQLERGRSRADADITGNFVVNVVTTGRLLAPRLHLVDSAPDDQTEDSKPANR